MKALLIVFILAFVPATASAQIAVGEPDVIVGESDAKPVAIVEEATGTVKNIIRIGPKARASWKLNEGEVFVDVDPSKEAVDRGGRWDGAKFTPRPLSPEDAQRKAAREAASQAKQVQADAREARIKAIEDENLSLKARIEALESKTTPGS